MKLSLCMPWEHTGGAELYPHSILISVLRERECVYSPACTECTLIMKDKISAYEI